MAFGRTTVKKCGDMAVIRYIIDPAIFGMCVLLFVKLHRIEVRREQQERVTHDRGSDVGTCGGFRSHSGFCDR